MTQLLPPKKEVALALLERSNVDVYLDPRARGVVVPPQFRKEPRLILKIGLNMPVPIPDLRLDEESMSCTLSFNRSPFYCVVPWSSVFAMVGEDGRGMVWPDDVPQELAIKVVEPGDRAPQSPAPGSAGGAQAGPGNGRRAARGSKLADDGPPSRDLDTADRPSRGGSSKKKKSKRDESARPMLVAVPGSSPEGRERQRAGQARGEDAEGAREAPGSGGDRAERRPRSHPERRDGVSPIPSSSSSRGRPNAPSSRVPPSSSPPPPTGRPDGARPKRELPPYLRVVK